MNRESFGDKEKAIMREGATGGGGETFSKIVEYSAAMGYESREAFIKEITGKTVLDLGSGLGGLAKNTFAEDVDTEIISLNPRLVKEQSRESEKEATRDYAMDVFPEPSVAERLMRVIKREPKRDRAQEMQDAHDKGAVAGFAHALPFKDESFNLILDKDAVSKYAARLDMDFRDTSTPAEREMFEDALREMIRVLKPGGKAKIFDLFGYGSDKDWKQNILNELGLKYEVIRMDKVESGLPPWMGGDTVAVGVEITK